MRTALVALVMTTLALATAPSDDSKLAAAIKQYEDGLLSEAVASLDAVIRDRVGNPSTTPDLVRAYLYRGAAFVGLEQEDAAKQSFRLALALDPAARVKRGEFPDRVVRVFEAARTGKSRSVMERPAGAPRKAGIGALGVAAIVGGAAVAAGGAVAVASGGSSDDASLAINFLSSTPSEGGTVTFSRSQNRFGLRVTLSIQLPSGYPDAGVGVQLYRGSTQCSGQSSGVAGPFALPAGQATTVTIDGDFNAPTTCFSTDGNSNNLLPASVTTDTLRAYVVAWAAPGATAVQERRFPIRYTLVVP